MLTAVRILFRMFDRYEAELLARGTTVDEEYERLRSEAKLLSQTRQKRKPGERVLTARDIEWNRQFHAAVDQVIRERAEARLLAQKQTAASLHSHSGHSQSVVKHT